MHRTLIIQNAVIVQPKQLRPVRHGPMGPPVTIEDSLQYDGRLPGSYDNTLGPVIIA